MQLEDLKAEYDRLQIKYGAKELKSIYNGGCTKNPDICFVFMNPTGRTVASDPNWKWNDEYRQSNRRFKIYYKTSIKEVFG